MKKIVSAALLLCFSNAYCTPEEDALQAKRMEWAKAYLEKQGAPVPDGGIKIIPENEMSQYQVFKEQRLQNKNDIAKLGYINKTHPEIDKFLNLKMIATHDLKKNEINYSPTSTHLRHSINELKMAYTFVGVPQNQMSEFIGVAPYLTYIKGQGWVGAIQLFVSENIGNCSFSENNIKLSHGSIVIAKEDVRNDINGKTTTVEINGTKETGFVYTVEWFDPIFFRKLECGNKVYSQDITKKVIQLAKSIDSN